MLITLAWTFSHVSYSQVRTFLRVVLLIIGSETQRQTDALLIDGPSSILIGTIVDQIIHHVGTESGGREGLYLAI